MPWGWRESSKAVMYGEIQGERIRNHLGSSIRWQNLLFMWHNLSWDPGLASYLSWFIKPAGSPGYTSLPAQTLLCYFLQVYELNSTVFPILHDMPASYCIKDSLYKLLKVKNFVMNQQWTFYSWTRQQYLLPTPSTPSPTKGKADLSLTSYDIQGANVI